MKTKHVYRYYWKTRLVTIEKIRVFFLAFSSNELRKIFSTFTHHYRKQCYNSPRTVFTGSNYRFCKAMACFSSGRWFNDHDDVERVQSFFYIRRTGMVSRLRTIAFGTMAEDHRYARLLFRRGCDNSMLQKIRNIFRDTPILKFMGKFAAENVLPRPLLRDSSWVPSLCSAPFCKRLRFCFLLRIKRDTIDAVTLTMCSRPLPARNSNENIRVRINPLRAWNSNAVYRFLRSSLRQIVNTKRWNVFENIVSQFCKYTQHVRTNAYTWKNYRF